MTMDAMKIERVSPTLPLLLAVAAAWSLGTDSLGAQSVTGSVLDDATGEPVAGALLRLRPAGGEPVGATATDSAGRFQLAAAEAGVYRLEVEALGYRPSLSDPLRLSDAVPVRLDVRLTVEPVPIPGIEVTNDVVNRRIREVVGMSAGLLRLRPIRANVIRGQADMGLELPDVIARAGFANLEVIRTREGPCFRFRGRSCLPVYLDGARLNRSWGAALPLEMIHTVVVVLPAETVAFPEGAVHAFTRGFMR